MSAIAQRSFSMAKVDQMVSALQKLYSKRSALDKQILDAEKKLAAEAKVVAKPAGPAKKPAGKKPAAKKSAAKPAAPKPPVKK
jgi:sec-independent protein translocase protein TatB